MLELVPNNTKRVEFTVFTPNAAGTNTPAAGLTVTVRVALAATSTSHVGSMSYTATEYTLQGSSKGYYADIDGAHLAAVVPGTLAYDQQVVIQFLSGTTLAGYIDAIIRRTRRL